MKTNKIIIEIKVKNLFKVIMKRILICNWKNKHKIIWKYIIKLKLYENLLVFLKFQIFKNSSKNLKIVFIHVFPKIVYF